MIKKTGLSLAGDKRETGLQIHDLNAAFAQWREHFDTEIQTVKETQIKMGRQIAIIEQFMLLLGSFEDLLERTPTIKGRLERQIKPEKPM